MDLQYFVELFCGGLTRGSIYALIALGYTMVYGIIELINFAHGEIYMIGAFTALIVASALGIMGFPAAGIIVIAALAAVIWCAAYGYTIEKIAYRPLRGAPRLSPLISAIGVSIFLQNYVSLAQTSDFVAFPQLITDFEFLDPISHIIGTSDFLIIVTSLVTMVALTLFIQYTKMGKAMRATAQNRKMAMLLGIDADRIISLTFIIGSSLAAIGGVLIANHVGQVNFFIGFIAAAYLGLGTVPVAIIGVAIAVYICLNDYKHIQEMRELKAAGLTVIVHVILGLPDETKAQMLDTVRYLVDFQPAIDGIKLQLLHILRGTKLAELYEQAPFPVFSMDEYIELLIEYIRLLPPDMVIHRISGDGPKKLLIAPEWSGNKRAFLNTFSKALRESGCFQGQDFTN